MTFPSSCLHESFSVQESKLLIYDQLIVQKHVTGTCHSLLNLLTIELIEGDYCLYLQDIFDNAVGNINQNDEKGKFIENYAEELSKYKDEDGKYYIENLMQVEEQLKEENIELSEEKLTFMLNLELKVGESYKEGIFITYNYIIICNQCI